MNAKRMPNLKEDQLLRAVKRLNKKKRGDVCTGDVAEYLGYHASGILLQLNKLKSKGVLKVRYIQGGRLPLWGVQESCFKNFNTESEKCKRCPSAVECYEASTNGT
jgi:hypothetical protein